MTASRNRLLLLVLGLLLAVLVVVPRVQQVQADRARASAEAARQAEAKRILESDPVKFEHYVKQVAIAAEVVGQGLQDASGACANLSGFESGLGDPPPETKTCTVTDPGEGQATVKLVLKDGREFTYPAQSR